MRSLIWGVVVALCCIGIVLAGNEGRSENDLDFDNNDAGPAPRNLEDASLIDDVLSSDYFEDDEQGIENDAPPDAQGSLPVVAIVDEEEVVTTTKPFCVGCPVEVDPQNDKIKEIATFAFSSHLNRLDGLERAQRMIRVVNAMTQIVAGQKYILDLEVGLTNCTKMQHDADKEQCSLDLSEDTFMCNFEVVEQAWINQKEVVRSNCKRVHLPAADVGEEDGDSDEVIEVGKEQKRRKKRDTKQVVGGSRDAEDGEEKLMDLAKFAVQQLDAIDADDDARLVMEVLESKKQTVSGWLYDLKIRVAHTTCKENETVTMDKCKNKIVPPYRVCSVKILFQPWQEVQRKVTESQCYPEKAYYKNKKGKKLAKQIALEKYKENDVNSERKSPRTLGGFQDVDTTSEELSELVNFVVESIDQQSNAMHAQKLVKIVEAQRQIVSGMKTKLVIELGYTSCKKKPSLDKTQCEIDAQRIHQFCNVTIWEQPWLKSKEITHSKCGPREAMFQEKRKKRSLSHFNLEIFADGDKEKFNKYVDQFGKRYESEEEYNYRLGVFKDNMKKVKVFQENEQGTAIYGATQFADLTEEEFTERHLGLRPDLHQGPRKMKRAKVPYVPLLPEEFDWRNYSAVTPVKNQGFCGSCWAFSVTGNIEGLYAKKYNKLVSFSEQELVDCDTLDQGCNGGLPENAYKAIQKLGGLETESAYPYDGHNDKCSFDSSKSAARVKGFVELPKNETEMAMWLVKHGPISIGLNANAMQFYMGGISHPWKFLCSKKNLDHGVLIVGYGVHTNIITHKKMEYWIIKNSWGPSWGEKGYYRVFKGDNTCGLSEMATSATIE